MTSTTMPRVRPGEETTGSGDPSHRERELADEPVTTGSGDPSHALDEEE
ncbi:hypothetical protein FHW69_001342 [Luteibacter sp. Sphag1AF]|nr:hypothetical protein [Luteibacter sp. Sphag1AF]MBB3226752.1 hypothetical protein [Luteibacter sp. Sphag1AF]